MNKLLSLLSLSFLFLYSNNTPCVETDPSGRNLRYLETFTDEICRDRVAQQTGYLCFANSAQSGCEEKNCEGMGPGECSRFIPTSNTEILNSIMMKINAFKQLRVVMKWLLQIVTLCI